MSSKSSFLISTLAIIVAAAAAVPAAEGIAAVARHTARTHALASQAPLIQVRWTAPTPSLAPALGTPMDQGGLQDRVFRVNRDGKGDRLDARTARRTPVRTERPAVIVPRRPARPNRILDGCEPAFSPVTVPSMAHVASRCVG